MIGDRRVNDAYREWYDPHFQPTLEDAFLAGSDSQLDGILELAGKLQQAQETSKRRLRRTQSVAGDLKAVRSQLAEAERLNAEITEKQASEHELNEALMEQLSELRAGCLNVTHDELIRRVTQVTGPEHRRGVWLQKFRKKERDRVQGELEQLRAENRDLHDSLQADADGQA